MLDGISHSEKMKPLTKEVPAQQGDNKTIEPTSHTSQGQSVHHRTVSIAAKPAKLEESESLRLSMEPSPGLAFNKIESPFKADDITIDDPEFKCPPVKFNKLALAIKIFCKSFMTISHFNNPETDRSARVQTTRNRVFTVTSILSNILTGTIILVGLKHLLEILETPAGQTAEAFAVGLTVVIIAGLSFGVFGIGWLLSQGISRLVTATVTASVDTREKMTDMTTFTSPQERFLKKYQRMEKSLTTLRTKLIDAKLVKKLDLYKTEESRLKAKEQARQEAAILNPDHKEKWHDSLQRYCLREWYEWYVDDSKKLEDAIRKTEDWLDRAATQKALLTNEQRELEELYDEVAPPIDGKLQLESVNPHDWVRV
ncbi:hypothetical protein J7438_08980 [Thalassotalea sp. G20_0]|uniref:hypothetical protein n=1 Tax=Thalassotalea sp. G20_0 TaxID=2821093 RepID=UPI001ADABE66|nr:hypothetical protein [Thalassotalea sp. G20_0]MBO9494220.1 hypothetical protein [Thalassotalea sp. G20_0]